MPKIALRLVAGACVTAIVIALAPYAFADDDSYLAYLSQHGIFAFKNPQGLVATGHAICDDLNHGVSIPDEMNRFQAMHYEAKPPGVDAMVNGAHQELCPGAGR
jgi:hypothetical protein